MSKITPHAQLELSKSGMLNNYRYFRSKLKSTTKLLVLVKANSYGHGAIEFAQSLEDAGADYLGVAFPVEGIQLKKNGITLPVLVLTCGLESYPEIIKYDLEPGMPNMESLIRFRDELRKAGKSSYPVHIKIDTGMHRLGFMKHEIPALKTFIKESPEIIVKSIYSHLAASDVNI
ncbi:MAG: alanine racemase [Bacteroidales bacterium]